MEHLRYSPPARKKHEEFGLICKNLEVINWGLNRFTDSTILRPFLLWKTGIHQPPIGNPRNYSGANSCQTPALRFWELKSEVRSHAKRSDETDPKPEFPNNWQPPNDTVDGRNLAPPVMYKTSEAIGLTNWCRISSRMTWMPPFVFFCGSWTFDL